MKMRLVVFSSLLFVMGVGFAIDAAFGSSRHYGRELCNDPRYYCIDVKHGDTWMGLFPNKKQRDIVMRLNRTNVAVYYRKWVLVPYNLSSIDRMDVSPLPKKIKSRKDNLVLVDLKKHAFAAYKPNGRQVYWGPISGGKSWCSDVGRPCHTVIGRFKMERKQQEDCISKTFPLPDGGAEMPYCMFFYRGYAMHASQLPGYHDSHGCVRMFYEDAKWLNLNFIDVGVRGTEVIVIR